MISYNSLVYITTDLSTDSRERGYWIKVGQSGNDNVTPADVDIGRAVKIIKERQRTKERTMKLRKRNYKKAIARIRTVN